VTNRYFNVLTPDQAIFDGVNKLNSGSDAVYRGMLAGWPSGGSLGTSTGSAPYGQFYDYLRNEEYVATEDLGDYLDGKEVGVVTGKYLALCGPDCFAAGSIPSVGAKLYAGTAGLLDVNQNWVGAASIGKVVGHYTVADAAGAGSFSAAQCLMDLPVL